MVKKSKSGLRPKEYKVYLAVSNTWVTVREEVYYAYYRDIWAKRKRAQAHGQCTCSRASLWQCDGDCLICRYHRAGDTLSIDYVNEDGDGSQYNLTACLSDQEQDVPGIIEQRDLRDALHRAIEQLTPEERRVCMLIASGKSEREIAAELDIPRNTYTYRRDRLLGNLRKMLSP